jgi:hypothetical protein
MQVKQLFLLFIVILSFFSIQCNKTDKDGTHISTYLSTEQPNVISNDNSNSTSPVNRHYTGIVNDNAVRIREQPSIESTVSGQLNQGLTVTVLGRSEKRMFLDGYDSYWLKIKTDNAEGWVYGAYINLTNYQYDSLPVLSFNNSIGSIDLNYPRNLLINTLIQKEKVNLELQAAFFLNCSIEEFYNSFVSIFNKQQNLRPFFLNTHQLGITETSRFMVLNSSLLCDYIQSSYSDNIIISPLLFNDNDISSSFVIYGFKKKAVFTGIEIKAITINIKRIENTNFFPLDKKTIIDFIIISPYSLEDFIEMSRDIDYFFSFMAGHRTSNIPRSSVLQMILGEMEVSYIDN